MRTSMRVAIAFVLAAGLGLGIGHVAFQHEPTLNFGPEGSLVAPMMADHYVGTGLAGALGCDSTAGPCGSPLVTLAGWCSADCGDAD
jgi:hypothetical protein